jgi:hypothetical protein
VTPSGIEPATFRFVVQYLNHCATAGGGICRVAPFPELEGNKESRDWRMKIWEAMAQKQDKVPCRRRRKEEESARTQSKTNSCDKTKHNEYKVWVALTYI